MEKIKKILNHYKGTETRGGVVVQNLTIINGQAATDADILSLLKDYSNGDIIIKSIQKYKNKLYIYTN